MKKVWAMTANIIALVIVIIGLIILIRLASQQHP